MSLFLLELATNAASSGVLNRHCAFREDTTLAEGEAGADDPEEEAPPEVACESEVVPYGVAAVASASFATGGPGKTYTLLVL
jgi:hypothetical protein